MAVGFGADGVTALSQIVRTVVETGHLECHIYPSRIVAHDKLLDTPQWTVSRPIVTAVVVDSSWLNRIRPGNSTVTVSVCDEEHRLQALRRPMVFFRSIEES